MMKHYGCTAEEVIGWLRIVRPGSVIGPQQQWMKEMQHRMWREGELYRQRGGRPIGLGLLQQESKEGVVRGPRIDSVRGSKELDGISKTMGGLSVESATDDTRLTRQRTEEEESNPKISTQGDYLRERRMQAAREVAGNAQPIGGGRRDGARRDQAGGVYNNSLGYRK